MTRKNIKSKTKPYNESEKLKIILRKVEEELLDHRRLLSIAQISKETNIPLRRCKKLCSQLKKEQRLAFVFEGRRGLPTIVFPYNRLQDILNQERPPEWIVNYEFQEERSVADEINKLLKDKDKYDKFKRLLYTSDETLEEAVAFTLEWLGFQNVKHYKEIADSHDIEFEYQGNLAVIEVFSASGGITKDKINQLNNWVDNIIEQGKSPDKVQGFLIVNHFRGDKPDERGDPLAPNLRRLLKRHRLKFLTTIFLYNIVKDRIENNITDDEARQKVWNGEPINEEAS